MQRYEINHEGVIVPHESALCSDLDKMLTSLLNQYGWTAKIVDKQGSCRRILLEDANGKSKQLNVYCGTIRNEARNPYEKKIQLGTVTDPKEKAKEDTLIIGVYVFEENDGISDAVFVGYPIDDDIRYETNPSIRGTFVNQLLIDTKNSGFIYDKEHNTVGFLAPFIYYYIDNHYDLHYTSHKHPEVSYASEQNKPCFETKCDNKKFPHNRILFGAPGTGKSFTLNREAKELLKDGGWQERVTFHPDYSYANFVGTYKPVMEQEEIKYKYVPGPFMRVLAKALKSAMTYHPEPHLLIIEEINRANVAAVFGDVFQLLDRASNNASEYEIAATKEMRTYLSEELDVDESAVETIKIPNNMFLWATMNSADQGVYPMDTAFKRRWDFTYLGIDDSEKDLIGKTVILGSGATKHKVEWNKLRKAINNFLAKEKINEDKQLGPYFIARSIVVPGEGTKIDQDAFIRTFKSKVIMYLFEDAAKQKRPKLFEGCFENSSRYSEICREFDRKGIDIFHHDIRLETEPEDMTDETPVSNG